MRRTDRECLEPSFLNDVLQRAEDLSLAFSTEDYPYVIPLNFALMDGALYMHCATEGRKLDLLAQDSRVGFTAQVDVTVDSVHKTTWYKCVYGTGHAALVTDAALKEKALQAISRKYRSCCPVPTAPAMLERTGILRVDIISLTGKQHAPKKDSSAG